MRGGERPGAVVYGQGTTVFSLLRSRSAAAERHRDIAAALQLRTEEVGLHMARWLQQNADILIFDEPTRGIDVGAKQEIYQLMNQLTESGKAIIMISSELPEVIGMSDRILVMHQGRITGEVRNTDNVTQEQLMELAIAPG